MAKSLHTGHRERLKQRFLEQGLDGFTDIQALELLLFYSVPRQDTNPIAHKLLEHFGSLSQVLEAPAEELMKVGGIGEHSAVLLSLMNQMSRFYLVDRARREKVLPTIDDCARYMMPYFYGRTNETVFLLCLDAKCKALSCKEVGEGSVNSAAVPIRRIVEMALNANATSIVLGHNHPSGFAVPSEEDRFTTHRLAAALQAVDILLADHIVVADDEFVSMVQSGFYRPQEYSLMI